MYESIYTNQLCLPDIHLLSLKLIFLGSVTIGFLVLLAYIAINPFFLFQGEYTWIPSLSNWDVYFITVFVPLSILFRLFFNGAGRAINPINKRFVNTASIIIILVIIAALWFYFTNAILIPNLESYLYMNLYPTFSSCVIFFFYILLSIFGLPLLCVSIASPVKTAMALKSLFRWFF